MSLGNNPKEIFASAAYTGAQTSDVFRVNSSAGMALFVDITVINVTTELTFKIQAQDPASAKWIDLIEWANVQTTVGQFIYLVKSVAGAGSDWEELEVDPLPVNTLLRVVSVLSGAGSALEHNYSVGGWYFSIV